MFPNRYFAARYFGDRYFPPGGGVVTRITDYSGSAAGVLDRQASADVLASMGGGVLPSEQGDLVSAIVDYAASVWNANPIIGAMGLAEPDAGGGASHSAAQDANVGGVHFEQ